MTSFSVFLKCCKEGTFWAGTMKYSMLPLFSPARAPRVFLYFIDLKNKTVYLSFNKKRVLLISGMSAWDECWVVRLLYSSSWWGSLVVCVCVALACSLSLPPSACVRVCVCVCSWSDVFQGGKQLVGITHSTALPKSLLPPNGRTCM